MKESQDPFLLYLSFLLIALLGGLHVLAGYWALYWTEWWFDMLMHFLAGIGGGLTALWFSYRVGLVQVGESSVIRILLASVLPLFIVGVAWEVFEYVNDITDSIEGYRLDVVIDLVMDALGAVLAGFIGWKRSRVSS